MNNKYCTICMKLPWNCVTKCSILYLMHWHWHWDSWLLVLQTSAYIYQIVFIFVWLNPTRQGSLSGDSFCQNSSHPCYTSSCGLINSSEEDAHLIVDPSKVQRTRERVLGKKGLREKIPPKIASKGVSFLMEESEEHFIFRSLLLPHTRYSSGGNWCQRCCQTDYWVSGKV